MLEGLDAVRKRPGTYIGSIDGAVSITCLENCGYAVDEALSGFGDRDETINKDGKSLNGLKP